MPSSPIQPGSASGEANKPSPFDEHVTCQEYQEYLNQGIQLSGEGQEYFIQGRLSTLRRRVEAKAKRVLDFGCGNGLASRSLRECFPDAEIVGVDAAAEAIEYARKNFAGPGITFESVDALGRLGRFDLCYVNGVFHHIPVAERLGAAQSIWRALKDGGILAFFENNPWNPGTRMVMKRIPFDRDAITLTIPESKDLLGAAGFAVEQSWTMFYFPRFLSMLRPLEPMLGRMLPLGAQYCVLGRKGMSGGVAE